MKMRIMLPLVLFVLSAFFLLFVSLPLLFACVCFFVAAISGLVTLTFFTLPPSLPLRSKPSYSIIPLPQPTRLRDGLPVVPRTVHEVLATMSSTEFEIFSAAVIIALGQGHTFERHCGGSGDQGIDACLRNMHNLRVGVQSKLYALDNPVGSQELREFAGSLLFHQDIYGFFITTSRFTAEARHVISANSAIRALDGQQLEGYLQRRRREIALAWADVLNQIESAKVV